MTQEQKTNYLKDPDLDVSSLFEETKEKSYAKNLLKKYLKDYNVETISNKNDLKNLLYLEVIHLRLQEKVNKFAYDDTKAVPVSLIDVIHRNLNQISEQKEKLGLFKKQEQNDVFTTIQQLKNKFKLWLKEHQGSRTLCCPYCGKMIMLKIRTDKWIANKHPFFKDRMLCNYTMIKLYLQDKITKQDVSDMLETSVDYVDFMINKLWPLSKEYQQLKGISNGTTKDTTEKCN